MPRQPKLRKKKIGGSTYWFTEAGGAAPYFGNTGEVSYDDARQAFTKHIGTLGEEEKDRKRTVLSAGELMDRYLDWVEKNRSVSNYKNRRTHLNRFGAFRPEGRQVRVADVPATRVTGNDLETWLGHLAGELKLDPRTRLPPAGRRERGRATSSAAGWRLPAWPGTAPARRPGGATTLPRCWAEGIG